VIRLAPSGDPVEVQVFLNKYLGIPIFLTVLWTMFQFAFAVSLLFGLIAKEVVVGTYGILLRIWGGQTWAKRWSARGSSRRSQVSHRCL
jgi:Fe2+ transport system protein B